MARLLSPATDLLFFRLGFENLHLLNDGSDTLFLMPSAAVRPSSNANHHLMGVAVGTCQLKQSDQALLREVELHIVQAHGDAQTMARSGIARRERFETESQAWAATLGRYAGFGAGSSRAVSRLPRKIRKAYEVALEKCQSKHCVNLLAGMFDHGSRMPVDIAWSLLLIGIVDCIPLLEPEPCAPGRVPGPEGGMGAELRAT